MPAAFFSFPNPYFMAKNSKSKTSSSNNNPAQGPTSHGYDVQSFQLEQTTIAIPLFELFTSNRNSGELPVYPVIIDVNLFYFEGREEAKRKVQDRIIRLLEVTPDEGNATDEGINVLKTRYSQQYVFAVLREKTIKELVRMDKAMALELATENKRKKNESTTGTKGKPIPQDGLADSGLPTHPYLAIYRIWPDFEVKKLTTHSIITVKANAAQNAFAANGEGICWAVLDSGIDGTHPHFELHNNLHWTSDKDPLQHRDFTVLSRAITHKAVDLSRDVNFQKHPNENPLSDPYGHGTHVAGIIAGAIPQGSRYQVRATTSYRDEDQQVHERVEAIETGISGMAPKCRLVSVKVLDDNGTGQVSSLIAAIQWIQEINGFGRNIRIHGINISLGYEFEPKWFACGQSPLCIEVNRLVKSGVVVVVAAGNSGYVFVTNQMNDRRITAGQDLTINDPGNADLAITVGATHREMPHIFGVSYFSSKGPTGDGRLKPDLVAPGEKILSCDSAQSRRGKSKSKRPASTKIAHYRDESGTSMAAPHVSGVIASFLSVRREFIGKPEAIKEIFTSTATDLKRERYFQGHGLVDLMRAIQSV